MAAVFQPDVHGGTSVNRSMFAVVITLIASALTFCQSASAATGAILIEFSSAQCPPCRAMKPVIAELERSGVPVRRVDVQAEPQLTARYGVRQTPTYIVHSGGEEVRRLRGTQTLEQLRAALSADTSGPLVPTGAKTRSADPMAGPQTRLAPIGGVASASRSGDRSAAGPDRSPSRPEAMPSVSLADAVERARAATVRLRVFDGQGYGAGTGTIIDTHGDEALVLTCGHLFRDTEGEGKVEVDVFAGGETHTVEGQVVDYDAGHRDIGLVAIRPGFPVQPVKVVAAGEKVQTGQTAFSFGCDRGDDPSRRDTRITGVNKYNQHLGMSNLEIAGAPIDGRSGGGLFDEQGRLIGVCNAADYQGDVGIYTGPGSIHWQLDRVNLASLYKPSGGNSGGNEAPPERLASLDDASGGAAAAAASSPTLTQPPGAASQSEPAAGVAAGQEVILIIRDRENPQQNSRVVHVTEPTQQLMRMIEQEAN